METLKWSEDVAALAVDALVDAGLIQKVDFERASDIVAEEINVEALLERLSSPSQQLKLGHYLFHLFC